MKRTDERRRPDRHRDSETRKNTHDRTDKKLPITGEVGSEGGSYADPTNQVAEFEGDIGRTAETAGPVDADAQTTDSIKPADE